MFLLVLIAGAVLWWAYKDGTLKGLRYGDVAAAVTALAGLQLFSHGNPALGAVAAGGAGAWFWFRRAKHSPTMTETEALALLELPVGADAGRIRAAHRRLIARVHPDHGGSTDLARRVNLARDTLLAVTPHDVPR